MTRETVARDHALSLAARGLYAYLSTPGTGPRNADAIAEAMRLEPGGQGGEGRRTVREAMAQLVTAGLVTRRKVMDGGGHWITEIHVESDSSGHTKPREDNADTGVSDVPHAGTSVPPALTRIAAARTDVPASGMPVRVAQITVFPAHADVPHGGTLSIRTTKPATTVGPTQSQDLNVASMRGAKPTTSPVEAVHTRIGEAENRPTVALIPGADLSWANQLYANER